jgi:nucleoside-triphosphatase
MKRRNIYILSDAVHTGKTTAVQHLIAGWQHVRGVVCPDHNGLRTVCDIEEDICYPLQLADCDSLLPTIKIGKYFFSDTGFAQARAILTKATSCTSGELVVVDEVGLLELEGGGLEPALSELLSQQNGRNYSVLLIVRDTLLATVIQHYRIDKPSIYNLNTFNTLQQYL